MSKEKESRNELKSMKFQTNQFAQFRISNKKSIKNMLMTRQENLFKIGSHIKNLKEIELEAKQPIVQMPNKLQFSSVFMDKTRLSVHSIKNQNKLSDRRLSNYPLKLNEILQERERKTQVEERKTAAVFDFQESQRHYSKNQSSIIRNKSLASNFLVSDENGDFKGFNLRKAVVQQEEMQNSAGNTNLHENCVKIVTNKQFFTRKMFFQNSKDEKTRNSTIPKRQFFNMLPNFKKSEEIMFEKKVEICVSLAEPSTKNKFKSIIFKLSSFTNFSNEELASIQKKLGLASDFKYFYDFEGNKIPKCLNCPQNCVCILNYLKKKHRSSFENRYFAVLSNLNYGNIFEHTKTKLSVKEQVFRFHNFFKIFSNEIPELVQQSLAKKTKDENLKKKPIQEAHQKMRSTMFLKKQPSLVSEIPFKIEINQGSKISTESNNWDGPTQFVQPQSKMKSFCANSQQLNALLPEINREKSQKILSQFFQFEDWNSNQLTDFLSDLKTNKNIPNISKITEEIRKSVLVNLADFDSTEKKESRKKYIDEFEMTLENDNFSNIEKLNDYYTKLLSSFMRRNLLNTDSNEEIKKEKQEESELGLVIRAKETSVVL